MHLGSYLHFLQGKGPALLPGKCLRLAASPLPSHARSPPGVPRARSAGGEKLFAFLCCCLFFFPNEKNVFSSRRLSLKNTKAAGSVPFTSVGLCWMRSARVPARGAAG